MWSLGTDYEWKAAVGLSPPVTANSEESGLHLRQQQFTLGGLSLCPYQNHRPSQRRAQLPLGEMALLRMAFLLYSRLLDPTKPDSNCWPGPFQSVISGWEGEGWCPSSGVLSHSNITEAH